MKEFFHAYVNPEDNVKSVIYIKCAKTQKKINLFLTMISDNAARSQSARNSRKTLLKYCAFAWGLPAVVVVTCFVLDYTDTIHIGYGMRESRFVAFFFT